MQIRSNLETIMIKQNKTQLKIIVSGSSGFVGSSLVVFLKNLGHEVIQLVRKEKKDVNKDIKKANHIIWDPKLGYIDSNLLEGADAVINLSGENVHGIWTDTKRRSILESRLQTTCLLSDTLAKLQRPPKVFVSASGITYYGNHNSQMVDETSPVGTDFLADVCKQWEDACDSAKQAQIRVIHLRIGAVLGRSGGMLHNFIPLFKIGLGGKWGTGLQHISWISIDDLLEMILFVIQDDSISGPINAVSPNPVTNYEFTKTLGRIIHRPTIFSIPETLAKLAFGEWIDSVLLSNYHVIPRVLVDKKFIFHFTNLDDALTHALTKKIK